MSAPDNAGRAKEIFEQTLDLASPEERLDYVKRACANDAGLFARVQALLRAHDEAAEGFLPEEPAHDAPNALRTHKPGDRIGRYRVLQQIGEGGCGLVYLAEQEEPIRRLVALKVIKLGMDTKQVVARFEAERQALALMDHPNIAKVLDAGATETGRPYFVMELVSGIKVTDYCDRNQLPTGERLKLFMQVCHAVQHAHQKGIIHRDIKPSNILVTLHDGVPVPKVIDFGIAKATQGELTDKTLFTVFAPFIGTPAYMSPEQAAMSGQGIDTRTDIYSLGVVLYELLTERTPFDCKALLDRGIEELILTLRQVEPARPSTCLRTLPVADLAAVTRHRQTDAETLIQLLRDDLDWIVMKTLDKERARRYATVNDLVADIQRHLNNEPVVARPSSRVYRLQKMVWRNKLAVMSTSAIAVALILGLGVSVWQYLEKSEAYRRLVSAQHKERIAREEAQKAQANESRQRKDTQVTAMRLAEVVDHLEVRKAQDLFGAGDTPGALATLANVLRQNPSNQVAVSRLMFALSERSYPLPRANPLSHEQWVWAAHFSPDGRRLLTISRDHTARVWETRTGNLISTLRHNANVPSAQFSPNGQLVATACEDKLARIWDLNTGQSLPLIHEGIVWLVRFSPDSSKLVTAGWDGTARIWDAKTGIELTRPLRHNNKVYSAFFSPDGERVVTASIDGTARVWNARSGAALGPPLQHRAKRWFAQFSPDGLKVVTACDDRTARVWNSETGEPVAPPLPHDDAVYYAEFSPDSQLLVTASADHNARVFGVRTGELIATLRHESVVRSARFSPDGEHIVTASDDSTARIWSARRGELLMEPLRHKAEVWYAEFSPDGRQVATASIDRTAQLWDVACDKTPLPPLRQQSGISSAAFSADGRLLWTSSKKGTVQVWDAEAAQPLDWAFSEAEGIASAAFSPDGQSILTLSQAHMVRVRRRDGQQVVTLPLLPSLQALSASFTSDGTQIITVCTRSEQDLQSAPSSVVLQSWDVSTGRELSKPFAAPGTYSGLLVTTNRLWLLTILPDGAARAWDARQQRPMGNPFKGESGISFAQFSPDGERIVTLSTDDTIQIWKTGEGRPVTEPLHQPDHVTSVQFDPDGRLVLTVAERALSQGQYLRVLSSFRVWDAGTGEMLVESAKHEGKATAAEFASDGSILTAIAGEGAWMWESMSGEVLSELLHRSEPVNLARRSPDGQRLLCVSGELAWLSKLERFPVPVAAWVPDFAEAVAGTRLNEHRALEPVPPHVLLQLSKRILSGYDESPYTRWAKRFLAHRDLDRLESK